MATEPRMGETGAEVTQVRAALETMCQEASLSGKWMFCPYQQLWFSPAELRAENAKGRFIWGPVNWILRSPLERLEEIIRQIEQLQRERVSVEIRMKKP